MILLMHLHCLEAKALRSVENSCRKCKLKVFSQGKVVKL